MLLVLVEKRGFISTFFFGSYKNVLYICRGIILLFISFLISFLFF